MPKVKEIYDYIDRIAPFSEQEEWDNSGLLIGDENRSATRVLMALDCTNEVLEYAAENGFELVITHHPIIFSPLKSVKKGTAVYTAVSNGISVICAHTSYDVAKNGVSDILAQTLSLENIRKSPSGILTLGETKIKTVARLSAFAAEKLNAEIRFCNGKKEIKTLAVCGGAGADYLGEAKECSADALLTGDAGHHDFLDALEMDMGLVAAGHFETEAISVKPLADTLSKAFGDVEFVVFDQKSPIEYI